MKWYAPDCKGPRNAHIANTHKARAIVQENRSIVARILVKELGFPQDRTTLEVAKLLYKQGNLPPNFPVPALLVDSVSDLSYRWSQWLDTMAINGIRI
jgi:hypothetical protein